MFCFFLHVGDPITTYQLTGSPSDTRDPVVVPGPWQMMATMDVLMQLHGWTASLKVALGEGTRGRGGV